MGRRHERCPPMDLLDLFEGTHAIILHLVVCLLTTVVSSGETSPTRWWMPRDHRVGMPLAAGAPGFAELQDVAAPMC